MCTRLLTAAVLDFFSVISFYVSISKCCTSHSNFMQQANTEQHISNDRTKPEILQLQYFWILQRMRCVDKSISSVATAALEHRSVGTVLTLEYSEVDVTRIMRPSASVRIGKVTGAPGPAICRGHLNELVFKIIFIFLNRVRGALRIFK